MTNLDPGPDGVTGNADDPGTSFTYCEYSTALQPRAFDHFVRVNDPQGGSDVQEHRYRAVQAALEQLAVAGVVLRDPAPRADLARPHTAGGEFNGNVESGALNPNAEINALDEGWESAASSPASTACRSTF